jgi:hypothetical protein
VVRRYVEDTMVLETEFETATGRVVVVDFMPVGGEADDLIASSAASPVVSRCGWSSC